MMTRALVLSLVLIAAASSTACATDPAAREAERIALYRSHAGEPVDSIQYLGSYSGWTPLGDKAFALWTRPSQAYLIEVHGPCIGLDFADSIGIRSFGGRISARFDQVYVRGVAGGPSTCQIREIRPLNVKALRADEKRLREERKMRRATDEPAPTQASGG
ncbi:DUF6491 family protein [Lysobacter brunescens]|uniref:DUF6491 family protein n=1 Tax=Lysobacter brunescens TaxID=262323 RepID=A0ABW2YGM5_9GAMM